MEESRYELFAGLMGRAAKAIQRIKFANMRKYSLSAAHTTCLCKLAEAGDDGLTQGQLVQLEGADRAHISRMLGDLRERGYVAPAGQEGAYRRRYRLTGAGQKITGEIQSIILSVNRSVSGQIPQADIDIFYRTLRTITQNLEREAAACR